MAKVGVGFGVMLLREGKVLLGPRHPDPEKAGSALHGEGTWTLPGGKIEFGETFEEAAAREVLEETGIIVNKEKMKLISLANDKVSDAHFVTIGFLCEEFEGEPRVMEPDKITRWEWIDPTNLPTPMFFPAEKIIKNHADKEIYKH